jgi:hypothetical protein
MDKNFILGVGCQKGATTWVHSQLSKSINVDMGFVKEYHVFDALYVPECRSFLTDKLKNLRNTSIDMDGLSGGSQLLKHLNFYLDTQNYYDYFDYLWHKGGTQVTTVGDITPTYCALPSEVLQSIKHGLEERGFNVKVIFLMRDPIERCWSMLRMDRRERLRMHPNEVFLDEEEQLERVFSTRAYELRTKYEFTVKNLERVFDQDNIFYSLYESLFEEKTVNELKSFINVSDFMPDINRRENVSNKRKSLLEVNDELSFKIFDHYRDTYEFCEKRFGVKELWPGWRYS